MGRTRGRRTRGRREEGRAIASRAAPSPPLVGDELHARERTALGSRQAGEESASGTLPGGLDDQEVIALFEHDARGILV